MRDLKRGIYTHRHTHTQAVEVCVCECVREHICICIYFTLLEVGILYLNTLLSISIVCYKADHNKLQSFSHIMGFRLRKDHGKPVKDETGHPCILPGLFRSEKQHWV